MHVNLVRWEQVRVLRRIDVQPLLAQWEKRTHPAQRRLEAYLDRVESDLRPAAAESKAVGLVLDVRLSPEIDLLRAHDLENYLTPIAQRLRLPNLMLAGATKASGDSQGSSVSLVEVAPRALEVSPDWLMFRVESTSSSTPWKERVRDLAARAFAVPIAPGSVALDLVIACNAKRRNWVTLWKPLGDCFGPALGHGNSARQFDVADGRITRLALHQATDDDLGNDVVAASWCRGIGA